MNYMEYYKSSVYQGSPKPIDKFTYQTLPFKLDIGDAHNILFKDVNNIKAEDWIVKINYKPAFFSTVQHLFEQVKPAFDSVFNSPFFIERFYIYRSIPFEKRTTSAIYHYDNTPPTVLKCIIYLNDVLSDNDGPIEFCKDLIMEPTRRGPNHWEVAKNGSRMTDDEVSKYEKVKIFGDAGTATIFYPCCVHRANPPSAGKVRDVVNFVVRPTPNQDELYKHVAGFEKKPGAPLMNPLDRYL